MRVSISSKQTQFARTVLTTEDDTAKRRDIEDLIFAAFGERIADNEQKWIEKIRSYIWQFNQKVMVASAGTMPNYLVLEGIEVTHYVQLPWLSRFDWLFVWAMCIQIFMLVSRLEKPREVVTIILFHLVGLGMELFKTSPEIGSWSYQGTALFQVATVPLFSGFMYAAVGSYIARSWRVMELSYTHYPNRSATLVLALAIYINFFTYHYILDVRLVLFALLILFYRRTQVKFRLVDSYHTMPLLVAFVLIALFIWFAENIGTFTGAWLYPEQVAGWHIVSIGKLGSWLQLMVISLVMVECLWARTTTPKSLQSERPRARA